MDTTEVNVEVSAGDHDSASESFDDYSIPEQLYERGWMDNVEDREEYRPGGFHPVQIGDRIGPEDRFRILHKLGNGGIATVWLCRDHQTDTYVSLKIIIAGQSTEDCPELKLVHRADINFNEPGGEYIIVPQQHFWIEGPNGKHLCLVLPVLGPRVQVIWHKLENPSSVSKDICRQVTTGMQFLHKYGICHGDFRPANVLLRISGFDDLSEEQLLQDLGKPVLEEIYTIDGNKPGQAAPRYLVQPIDLETLDLKYLTNEACIIDFGECYDMKTPPASLGIPFGFSSPELIFDSRAGIGSDVWALACTIYELRSMLRLYENFGEDENEVILQMVRYLGKLPEPWWSTWDQRRKYFKDDGSLVVNPKTGEPYPIAKPYTIQELLAHGMHFRMGGKDGRPIDIVVPEEERDVLADLLVGMMKFNPDERPCVGKVLEHPWFKKMQ